MKLLDRTLPTAPENLALDEALLEQAEQTDQPTSLLRLWESPQRMVVIGRSSKIAQEVDLEACRAAKVGVYRRTSGGGAIVAGPGCLMYGVILSYDLHPDLRLLDQAHQYVLSRVAQAIGLDVDQRGTSDLVVGQHKISGNAMRCRRRHFLYHGTILYNFSLDSISQLLRKPPHEPEYREGRSHAEFVSNLTTDVSELRERLQQVWQADEFRTAWPEKETKKLVTERYSQKSWNYLR